MHLTRVGKICIGVFVTAGLLIAASTDSDQSIIHKVKKGESISLICIDLYGYYSAALGKAIAKSNPQIKNIDLIYVGQSLKLRKPQERKPVASTPTTPAAGTTKDTSQASQQSEAVDELFIKKVAAIQGVVTCVEGTASVKISGKKDFSPLTVNSIVYPGDVIKTGSNGRVELIINKESVVRLKENTLMTVQNFRDPAKENEKTSLGFSVGTIWTKMKKFKDKFSRFELELPTAVAGVHGTVYQTTVSPDSSSEVKVFSGEVAVRGGASERGDVPVGEKAGPGEISGPSEVSLEAWTQIIQSMQMIKISKDGKSSEPQSFTDSTESDWEKWNKERDQRIAEMFMEL
ncbi:MAG: hypothetical protein GX640_22590 [Fibrobacter sp.]|nr:hypothetical protein [Fibrobacter sp.]